MSNTWKISTGRYWLIFIVMLVVAAGVFYRIIEIQFFEEEEKWKEKGAGYSENLKTIVPSKGNVLSKNGSIMAISVPVYHMHWDTKCEGIDWNSFEKNKDEVCKEISRVLDKDDLPMESVKRKFDSAIEDSSRYYPIEKNIPYLKYKELKDIVFIKNGRLKSGLIFEKDYTRENPFDDLASITIGSRKYNIRGEETGIELAWNQELAGVEGLQTQYRIPGGYWLPKSDDYIREPKEGIDVLTTIDMHLQDVATSSLRKQLEEHDAAWGVVVLMEVETGYVRAISNLEWNDTTKLKYTSPTEPEHKNYAIYGKCEPGSTFKLASLMTCLESGELLLTDSIDTGNGVFKFHDQEMKDSNWKEGGHGKISVKDIFTRSSNVGSALAVKQSFENDPQKFLDGLQNIGVTRPLNVNLPGEQAPNVHTSVSEKDWTGVSLTSMAIGYELEQTPLQTLALYSAVANNGKMMKPVFVTETRKNGETVESFGPEVINERICKASTLQDCKTMLESVCIPEGEGTAARIFKDSPYKVAGKTGTCRITENGHYQKGRYRASFAGYFPADNPIYSCIVVISDTKSGSYYGSTIAAPVFKDLADLIYATDAKFHTTLDSPLLAEEHQYLPTANDGERSEMIYLYETLGIPYEDKSNASDWINVSTAKEKVSITSRTIEQYKVPDVKGMGLKDALYLLENAGLRVEYEGNGVVKSQTPNSGSDLTSQSTIELKLK